MAFTSEKIQFVDADPDKVVADIKAYYEGLAGRTVQPGQAEMLVFNSMSYRLSLFLNQLNETANGLFLAFATGPALDKLGELLGVTRLTAAPATCTLRFVLNPGHGALNIPSGIRVQTTDGQAIFITTQSKSVDSITNTVDLSAECTTDGTVGNGYAIGNVSVILDPLAYVVSASNIDVTGNGADAETDAALRERIRLAPSKFSVAGPKGAYEYFAKSAHPNIVDVAVTIGHDVDDTIIPGQVDIFPLMADGTAPDTEITDAIYAICNDEKIRPLTDTVIVKSPTIITYAINIELILLTDAVQSAVVNKVTANLQAFREARAKKLGIDVVKSQLIGLAQVDGVYKVNIVSPAIDIVAGESVYTKCTGITVTATGTADE